MERKIKIPRPELHPPMRCTNGTRGNCQKKNVPYGFLGESRGTFEGLVCNLCGETLCESAVSDSIESEVKRRGLWGLWARTKIAEVGNALDVRIPKSVAQFLSLQKGQEIIVEPIDRNTLQIIVE